MLTATEDSSMLREKIRKDLDVLDIDDLKQLYKVVAELAAQKAARFADLDWDEKKISREHINRTVTESRNLAAK